MIFSRNNFFETSDGTILYYEDYGQGEPILLLHGFCCSSQVFKRNIETLSKNNRLILMDLRGHGASSKTLSGVTMPRMGILDSTLYPFSEESWNMHGNRCYNMDKANDRLIHMQENHEEDAWSMVNGMVTGDAPKEEKGGILL